MVIFSFHVVSLDTVIWSVMDSPIDCGLPCRIPNVVFSHPTSLHPQRSVLLHGLLFCWLFFSFLFKGIRVAQAQVVQIVFCLLFLYKARNLASAVFPNQSV